MTDEHPMEPADAFHEISLIKLSETNVDGVLQKIAELARRSIPGAAEVSVPSAGARARTPRRSPATSR
jgi:hypothetical protein